MDSLMRLVIFPNVFAMGCALAVGVPTQSVPLTVTAMLTGYLAALFIGRRLWP